MPAKNPGKITICDKIIFFKITSLELFSSNISVIVILRKIVLIVIKKMKKFLLLTDMIYVKRSNIDSLVKLRHAIERVQEHIFKLKNITFIMNH